MHQKTYKTISRSSSFDCGRRPKTTWQTYMTKQDSIWQRLWWDRNV